MSNKPRIEREALAAARLQFHPDYNPDAFTACTICYRKGATYEIERASHAIGALEDLVSNWEAGYQAECAAIDRINKDRQKPIFWDGEDYKMRYPPVPDWVTEAKQLLKTYKADL